MYISSLSNETVKKVSKLKKKIVYGNEFEVVLEGERLVSDAVRYGAHISCLLVREDYKGALPEAEVCHTLKDTVFDKLADTVTPQGIIALATVKKNSINTKKESDCIIILDNIRDPGNMGTIIRTAHSVGASGVLITKGCTNPYSLKALRSAMASTFAVDIQIAEDISEIYNLKKAGYSLCCGVLGKDSSRLYNTNLAGKHAFITGNEGSGVSEEIISLCDKKIIIPMPGGAESLNAAVATAVMVYEHLRQNRF